YRQDPSGLVEADRQAVRAALTRWGWDGSDGSPYQIGTADGITVEFYASGLDGAGPFYGGNLAAQGVGTEPCALVLDVARAGSFTVTHDGDPSSVILVSEAQRADLPADMAADPKLMVCSTPAELVAALEGGFDKWREFRDLACGRSPEGGPP